MDEQVARDELEERLREYLQSLGPETLDADKIALVVNAVVQNMSYVIFADEDSAKSEKVRNVTVEFDIEDAKDFALSTSPILLGEPHSPIIGTLCRMGYAFHKGRVIELEPETGYVAGLAGEKYGLKNLFREEDLVELAVSNSESNDKFDKLSPGEVEECIEELVRVKSFKSVYVDGEEHLLAVESVNSEYEIEL